MPIRSSPSGARGPMRFWSGSALPANAGSDEIPGKGEQDTLSRVETLAQRCWLAILICSYSFHSNGHAWFVVLNTRSMGGNRHHTVFVSVHHPYWAATRHELNITMSLLWSNGNQSRNQCCCALVKQRKPLLFYSCHFSFSSWELFAHYFVRISLFSM